MIINPLTFKNIQNTSFETLTSGIQLISILILILLAGCGSPSKYNKLEKRTSTTAPTSDIVATKGGGYYLDDGPDNDPPPNLHAIPDAIPKSEPLRKVNMQPYVALGKTYKPMTALGAYKKSGVASWYGRRYHGRQTASGEVYDMYAMTAAHPTLPLPSYARVTNTKDGKSIVVRINDRGPFLSNRLIDLSYTAAYKLGVLTDGSAKVEVESIFPDASSTAQVVSGPTVPAPSSSAITNNTNVNKIYLQLGAFGAVGNAYNFLSHIQTELPWLSEVLDITEKDGLFKIQAGPYPNQMLAQQAADTITQQLAIKPMLLID